MNARPYGAALALSMLLFMPSVFALETVSHGRFKNVTLYRPAAEIKEVVLFLSGDGGWNQGVVSMAQALAGQGALVAGIHVPEMVNGIEADKDACSYPASDLENLSHFLQGYAKMPTYKVPMLMGYSSGATLAYAMVAQAPDGTFSGALSLGFCPNLEIKKPLCKGESLHSTPRKDGKGVDLLPVASLQAPWIALQGSQDQVCDAKATQAFVAKVGGGSLVMLPQVGHGYSVEKNWMPQYLAAYQSLSAKRAAANPPPAPPSLAGLPVVEVSASGRGDLFAVMLSGDGGWAGVDKGLAAAMAAQGIPVAGLDSLSYFWTRRTPEGLAADVDRLIRYYADHWHKSRVVLIGYSQGADVLPFAFNRLPAASKSLVAQTVLIGPGEQASFEFHLGNWVGLTGGGVAIRPEVEKLHEDSALCLYGQDESDSLCAKLSGKGMVSRALPGGHHFNGAYDFLAAVILARLKPR